ncbi:MAG: winged helix-turn-helix transcriptional regulator [Candidatus Phaeomarinobacter sp.]
MARATDLFGDRWTLLILREALYGVTRFEDLRADLGIPRAALSQRLDRMVAAGLLSRHPYREGTSRTRHEYRMTDTGRDAVIVLVALMDWGDRHLREDASPIDVVDAATGEKLSLALTTDDGRTVQLPEARMNILRRRK